MYYERFGIPFNIFRICVPYGNNFDNNYSFGTVGHFLKKAIQGENIALYGDGSLKRTFTHINDVCHQINTILLDPTNINETYNIAGETFSLYEVATFISNRFKVIVENIAWPNDDLKIESGHTYFDSSKISRQVEVPIKTKFTEWVEQI